MNESTATRAARYLSIALRWLIILATVFAATYFACKYFTEHILPQVYTARATLQLPASDLVIPSAGAKPEPVAFQPEFENTIRSPDYLLSVIKDLGLEQEWAKRLYKSDDQLPDVDALTHMEDVLKFQTGPGTNQIVVVAASDVPKEAADIANAVADRYKAIRDIEADRSNHHGDDELRDQIAEQEKVVEEKKAAVEKIRQQLGSQGIVMPSGADHLESDLEDRKKELLQAQEDYDARKVLWDSVKKLPDDQLISTLNGLGRSHADIASLQVDSAQTESEIDQLLKAGAKEGDPKIVALRQEDGAKQKQLRDLVAGLRRAMQIDVDMAKSRVTILQQEVDALTKKLTSGTASVLLPFRSAERDLEQQQAILDALNVRLRQVIADSSLQESPVRIISRAEVPTVPTHPDRSLAFVLTMIASSVAAVLAASFVEIIFLFLRAAERADN